MDFKIEQIAIATDNPGMVMNYLSQLDESFSFADKENWICDQVQTEGVVYRDKGPTIADLYFHYKTGIEFEILDYRSGPNWHEKAGRKGTFISHIGMHVDEFPDLPFECIQHVFTKNHSNAYLKENGRKYEYRIYNTRGLFGFDVKLIRRIDCGEE